MTERQLKSLILEFLNLHQAVDIALPYNQIQASKTARRSKWQPTGIPDIVGNMGNGISLYVEVKLPQGRVSKAQDEFIISRLKRGSVAFVARSVQDCEIALANFGY